MLSFKNIYSTAVATHMAIRAASHNFSPFTCLVVVVSLLLVHYFTVLRRLIFVHSHELFFFILQYIQISYRCLLLFLAVFFSRFCLTRTNNSNRAPTTTYNEGLLLLLLLLLVPLWSTPSAHWSMPPLSS